MFKSSPSISYQHVVEGTWGEFTTPTGRVAFILTKARLGQSGTDNERRLTSQLRPVREVIEVERLDFNQLLQRDLDDHRVAEGLIPYLLKPKTTGPAFFPPIMAVLLPFASGKPSPSFPEESYNGTAKDDSGISWVERRLGAAYRVQRLADDQGDHHPIKLGRLSWNPEYAQLVVLDGQHRAMALLAIDRTVNHQWGSMGAANRYRHFYEYKVAELMKKADPKFNLDSIEIPVTVCWFPELNGKSGDPHMAARKLFVDVNKEARTPSDARLTLLSDAELVNILTRSLLNRLRQPNPSLPLHAIEYDNPEKDAARPVKWTVVSNLNLLKIAVQRCVFGPKKYLINMKIGFGGRLSSQEMDAFMRAQLDVETLYPEVIPDGDRIVQRSAIGNDIFPHQEVDRITDRFMASWGGAILTILGGLLPYAAHCRALQVTKAMWAADDAFSSIAYDALFGGVGAFWTLRDTYEHWFEKKQLAKKDNHPEPPRPDILKAWDIIDINNEAGQYVEFDKRRSKEYLGKDAEKDCEKARKFYGIVNTHACQLGAILAFASLAHRHAKPHYEIGSFAETLVEAWNAALSSQRAPDENRLLFFARSPVIRNPINRIVKMDTPLAVHFRYFWFELLRLDAAQDVLQGIVDRSILDDLADKARTVYFEYLVEENIKALKVSEPGLGKRAPKKARDSVIREMSKALNHWLEVSKADAEAIVAASLQHAPTKAERSASSESAGDAAKDDTTEGDTVEAMDDQSVTELLNGLPED